jgi:5-methylcytosine-specific restriction endonuclease McrA
VLIAKIVERNALTCYPEGMSKKTLKQLINLSKPLLERHGILSTAYLMRKLRVEYDMAREIMKAFGLPVFVFAEEYTQKEKVSPRRPVRPKPIIDHLEYRRRYYSKRRIAYLEARKLPIWEQDMIERFYDECPKGYHVDHIIPIARGGKHEMANLQWMTSEENLKKNARWKKEEHVLNSCPIKILNVYN